MKKVEQDHVGFLAQQKEVPPTPEEIKRLEREMILKALDYDEVCKAVSDKLEMTRWEKFNLWWSMKVARFFFKAGFKRWEKWSMFITVITYFTLKYLAIPGTVCTLLVVYVL